eukprot:2091820-Alexandrium_andersonii.AAC.1
MCIRDRCWQTGGCAEQLADFWRARLRNWRSGRRGPWPKPRTTNATWHQHVGEGERQLSEE